MEKLWKTTMVYKLNTLLWIACVEWTCSELWNVCYYENMSLQKHNPVDNFNVLVNIQKQSWQVKGVLLLHSKTFLTSLRSLRHTEKYCTYVDEIVMFHVLNSNIKSEVILKVNEVILKLESWWRYNREHDIGQMAGNKRWAGSLWSPFLFAKNQGELRVWKGIPRRAVFVHSTN